MDKKEKTVIDLINEWFDGDRNYKEGVNLLDEAAPNMRAMIKHLKRGETSENMEHLTYQLFKISDHTDEKICYAPKKKKVDARKDSKKPVDKSPIDKKIETPVEKKSAEGNENPEPPAEENTEAFIPESEEDKLFLAKIVDHQKKNYNLRAVTHKRMVEIGDLNTPDVIQERKDCLTLIAHCTLIVDFLHNQKLTWKESGIKPDDSILEWVPEPEAEEKKDIVVEKIAEVDLQSELSKVRSRLSKYTKKLKDLSGKKLEAMKEKQSVDIKLKEDLIKQIDAIRNK